MDCSAIFDCADGGAISARGSCTLVLQQFKQELRFLRFQPTP